MTCTTPSHDGEPRGDMERDLKDILFWEELRDIAEQVDIMTAQEQNRLLMKVVHNETTEGPSFRRDFLKRIITQPLKRKELIEQVKSGAIYQEKEEVHFGEVNK